MCLRGQYSVTCFNLDKTQEVRPLGVGVFIISLYTSNWIVYWATIYFGVSKIYMFRWMDIWLKDFLCFELCFNFNPILITIRASIRNTLLWKCVIPITLSTYLFTLDYFSKFSFHFCCPVFQSLDLFGAWLPLWGF